MNAYSFYHKGKLFLTCWGNDEAENFIWGCADLARMGLTPQYHRNPDNGRSLLMYSDSFSIKKLSPVASGGYKGTMITPETVNCLARNIKKELSAFTYNGEEWEVKMS